MDNIIGLKELRQNTDLYITQVQKGKNFIVVRKSRPVFKISSVADDNEFWEPVVDLTKIKKDGVPLRDLLSRL